MNNRGRRNGLLVPLLVGLLVWLCHSVRPHERCESRVSQVQTRLKFNVGGNVFYVYTADPRLLAGNVTKKRNPWESWYNRVRFAVLYP